MTRPRIVHVHSTFSLGGKEARAVRLMNAFGEGLEHVVLSAVPGAFGARAAIEPHVAAAFPSDHPPLTGRPSLARWRALADYLRGFDLVLTYNWGAMDAVMAHRLFGGPPLIHHEDGFNSDEAQRQKPARILFRRIALAHAKALVVPSQRLERIAVTVWRQPRERVVRIANGVPVDRYVRALQLDAIPGLERREGEVIVGTLAGLRSVKNLPRLVRAFAASGIAGRLVIVGEGEERARIVAEAERCGVGDRLILPGFLADPTRYVGLFDIFALSSDSEQFPISVIEAMAAAVPVATTDVGDIRAMVADDNRAFITPAHDEAALAESLRVLASDAGLRYRLGRANRGKAISDYSEEAMIARYAALYGGSLGRSLLPH